MESSMQQQKDTDILQNVLYLIENDQSKQALELLQSHQFDNKFHLIQKQMEAEILASLNEHNRAECAYLAIIREYPDNMDTKFALSQLYQQYGRYSQANEILDQVIEKDPGHFMAWNNKGNILKSLKNYEEAIVCYQKALEIDPHYNIALNNLCLIYAQLGRYNDAIEVGNQIVQLYPQSVQAYTILYDIYMQMNNHQEAMDVINLGINHCGDDARLTCLQAG